LVSSDYSFRFEIDEVISLQKKEIMGYFRVFEGANGQYYFNLNADNHKIILQSEGYTTKANAEKGVESVRVNSPQEDKYDRRDSKDNQHYFVLKAGNGEIIGVSEMYHEKAGMENGIQSVLKNGPDAALKDETK